MVVIEFNLGRLGHNEWNIRSVQSGVRPVVFAPAAIDSRLVTLTFFVIVISWLDLVCTLPNIIFDVQSQLCVFTVWLPFAGATQLILMCTGDVDHVRVGTLCPGNGSKQQGERYDQDGADRKVVWNVFSHGVSPPRFYHDSLEICNVKFSVS